MSRARWAVAAWLAVLAIAIAIAARATYVADLSSFLPASPTPQQRLLVQQVREGALSRVMLLGIDGADAVARSRVSHALAAALRSDPRFSFVANGEDGGFERERELLLRSRYVLSPRVTPERFTVAGLRAAIGETIDLLASPAGLVVKALVPRDPTGELIAVIEALQPADGPKRIEGTWGSADGTRALLIARTAAAGGDIDAQAAALAAVEQAFAAARARSGDAAAATRLVASGAGVFAARSRAMIEHDVTRLSILSAVLVAALLLVVYRSGRALLLGLVPVLTGAAVGIAAVAVGFGTVHGLTLGFGTTLIGEAVDYAIYFFVSGPQGDAADRPAAASFWATIRLGVLTSIAGFCALVFSGLPGLAQLGVYSICGLAAAALAARYVLPALLPAGFAVRDLSPAGVALLRAAASVRHGRAIVAAVGLACLALLAVRHDRLWDRDIASLNPISGQDRRIDAELRAALGTNDARLFVAASGASLDAALDMGDRAGAALAPLVRDGRLASFDAPSRFLPSATLQRARIASLPDEATLKARLADALRGSPLSAARLDPFLADVARARTQPLLTRDAIRGTALEAALDGLVFRDGDGWVALLGVRSAGAGIDAGTIRAALVQANLPGTYLIDVKGELDSIYAGYFSRALAASLAGLAVIVLLLFATLRSPARVATVMLPMATGVLLAAAAHAALGTPMSLLHLVALLLVAAIGSNYALFFERLARDPGPQAPRTVASLALANLTTVAGFGALALSSIPVLSAIGSTVAIGAFATLACSALAARHGIIRP